jgi:hypothetical protein
MPEKRGGPFHKPRTPASKTGPTCWRGGRPGSTSSLNSIRNAWSSSTRPVRQPRWHACAAGLSAASVAVRPCPTACVDARPGARRISGSVCHVVGCCHVSGLRCGASLPRASMGVRGSDPHHWNALEALPVGLVLPIPSRRRCAIPVLCPSYAVDSLAIAAAVTRRRPELGNSRLLRSAPMRRGRSYWPAPRSPASAACARAFRPAMSAVEHLCAWPSAPPRLPR